MQVLLVAGLGVASVLFSILAVRLHPFMSLLLGTLVVLLLTPNASWLRNELDSQLITIQSVDTNGVAKLSRPIENGEYLIWRANQALPDDEIVRSTRVLDAASPLFTLAIKESSETVQPGKAPTFRANDRMVELTKYRAIESQADRLRLATITKRLSAGLSTTFQKIGLAIAMAAIIGVCLLESGAANSLVQGISRIFGAKRTAPTLMVSGFILGVPIFFDTVFYLLLPLAKAFGKQRPSQALLAILSIIVGATMAHSLVPPTPGPLLVASRLGISIGTMMLGGIVVGGSAACIGFLYSLWCNKHIEFNVNAVTSVPSKEVDQANQVQRTEPAAIPIWLASMPLGIPICCLGGMEIWKAMIASSNKESSFGSESNSIWNGVLDLLGEPGFVLMIAAIVSYCLLRRIMSSKQTTVHMTTAIADAGTILLLTCAGGAFGAALEQLRISEAVSQLSEGTISPHGILFAAFFLTGLIRVAQGSATIAMITSVGIVAPFVQDQTLPFHPVYVALSIGCGSKLMPWMNDSGFWQVSTMTGLTTTQTLKTFSVALTLMGIVGFCVTLLGAYLLPLVTVEVASSIQ
jgi:gluconate:H+ symporter, GntP family